MSIDKKDKAEKITQRLVLHFHEAVIDKPVIYMLVKDYDLEFNILKAHISPDKEGMIVLQLSGSKEKFEKAMKFLKDINIRVEPLQTDLVRNEAKCIHCGVCTISCPTGALSIDRNNMKLEFYEEKCIACDACSKICPTRAIVLKF